jgi:exonuclease SbcC
VRPLKLSLKGFTAFREEQSIDFSQLDLFAIAGPTGAGKSSILDAITYALYGQVERVTKECAQLISQGLPAMAVQFEFSCGNERYRIARRTYRHSPTDVVLERFADGEWRSEAGKVREVGVRIEEIIGLDYDGFTRAVLLPQGKFDQFLAGDASARRRILTDLLGLQLFDRMASIARKRGSAADIQIQTTRGFLESEFKRASPEAVETARAEADWAKQREHQLDDALGKVRTIESTAKQARQRAADFQSCSDEASVAAGTCRTVAAHIRKLATQLTQANAAAAERTKELTASTKDLTKARERLDAAVAKLGSAKDLNTGRSKAEQLSLARADLAKAQKTVAELEPEPARLQTLAEKAGGVVEKAVATERRAKTDMGSARSELDQVQHDERLAAITAELRVGAPCPICGAKLTKLPALGQTAARLKAAKAKFKTSEQELEGARESTAEARLKAADVARKVKAAVEALERARTSAAECNTRIVTLEKTIKAMLGPKLPHDVIAAFDERITTLEELDAEVDAAAEAKRLSESATSEAQRLSERVASGIDAEVNRLPIDAIGNLRKRLSKLLPAEHLLEERDRPAERTPELRAALADELETRFKNVATRLSQLVRDESQAEPKLHAEAQAIVGSLVPPAKDLESLLKATVDAARSATRVSAEAEKAAKDVAAALARKLKLTADLAELEQRAARLHAIALDLRSDAIVDFLQAQALEGLALEGSARLRQLSVERYELRYRDDEFYVADIWNGGEERSVRTLSGGETFLASLALALSLSGQVRALSSVDHARLDSLFLDEGFASLDREAVDLVIDGLERLGSDGRIVGVITHLREITDQFPRIEVEKLATGSRLKLVAAG